MKKMNLFLVAASTCAGIAWGALDPINGDNEVGFAALSAPANSKTILAVPFQACLGNGDSGYLSDLVSTNGLTASDSAGTADQLVVLVDDSGPKYNYYWLQAGVGWTAVTTSQLMPDGSSVARTPPAASAFEIDNGLGFWLKRVAGSGSTAFVSGQVPTGKQATTILPGLNLIGTDRTESYNLNDLDWTGATGANLSTAADQIRIVNANGSETTYFYFVDSASWGGSYTALSGKWLTQGFSSNITIPAGRGFWYLRRGGTGFTFRPDGE